MEILHSCALALSLSFFDQHLNGTLTLSQTKIWEGTRNSPRVRHKSTTTGYALSLPIFFRSHCSHARRRRRRWVDWANGFFTFSFHYPLMMMDSMIAAGWPGLWGGDPNSENPTFLHYWARSALENSIFRRLGASCAVCPLAHYQSTHIIRRKNRNRSAPPRRFITLLWIIKTKQNVRIAPVQRLKAGLALDCAPTSKSAGFSPGGTFRARWQ